MKKVKNAERLKDLKKIKAIEDEYSTFVFITAFSYMFDIGSRNLDNASLEKRIQQIKDSCEASRQEGKVIVGEYTQISIVKCAVLLSKISIYSLLDYMRRNHKHL